MKTVLLSVILLFSIQSFAGVDITAVGGITQMTESISQSGENYSVSANVGKSYGALLGLHPSFGWGLTTGILYAEVNFHEVVTGLVSASGDALVPYYQIPAIANYWFGGVAALGAGAYYSFPGGNINALGTSGSFSQENFKGDDYGLAADLVLKIPIGFFTHVLLDAMYEYGLENVSNTSNITVHNQGFIFLVGFGFSF